MYYLTRAVSQYGSGLHRPIQCTLSALERHLNVRFNFNGSSSGTRLCRRSFMHKISCLQIWWIIVIICVIFIYFPLNCPIWSLGHFLMSLSQRLRKNFATETKIVKWKRTVGTSSDSQVPVAQQIVVKIRSDLHRWQKLCLAQKFWTQNLPINIRTFFRMWYFKKA